MIRLMIDISIDFIAIFRLLLVLRIATLTIELDIEIGSQLICSTMSSISLEENSIVPRDVHMWFSLVFIKQTLVFPTILSIRENGMRKKIHSQIATSNVRY